MPITRNRIKAENQVVEYSRRKGRNFATAKLGNNAGDIQIGTTDYVFVRLHGDSNQVVRAENPNSVPLQHNLPVLVESVKRGGITRYVVIGREGEAYTTDPYANAVGAHAGQHEIRDFGANGFDPLNVYTRARVELRARTQTTPDMTLYVEHGKYQMNGVEVIWNGGSSGAFTAPSAGYKRFDLLYFDSGGALAIKQGTAVAASLFSSPSLPSAPTGGYCPICYVLLSGGQTTITETSIMDARIAWGSLGSGSLSSHAIDGAFHTASGLTTGHFLKATGATSFGFAAHGLTYSDVGAAPSSHNLLSTSHGDTLADTVAAGDVMVGNATPKWARLAANSTATKKYLQSVSSGVPAWNQVDYADLSSVPSTFAIATPGTLTVSTTNSASGAHTHAITTSSDVSAGTSAILASNAGALTLRTLSVTNNTGAIVTMQAASAASTYLVAKTNGGSIRGSFGWRHDTDEGGIGNDAQWIMNWGAGSNPTVKFRSTGLHTFSGSVGIGDDPVTNLYVKGASVALDKVIVRDTLADGYSSIGFQDYNGASACGFGYANPSGWAPLANKLYFYSVSKSIKFSIDGGTTAHLYINAADGGTSVASVNQNASGAKLRVAGHITCDVDAASDLGTSTLRWGNIYGAPVLNTVTKTDSYTAGAADCVIVCNKATAMTITLPAATGNGKHYIISSIGAGAVLVDANGSETIAGQLTQTINQYESMQIVDYASGKWIIV